mgnify:CR=1 FL=1
MYSIVKTILYVLCLVIIVLGIIGMLKQNKYKKDTEAVNNIISYFKKAGKGGINPKDIPKEILKTGYITWMLKDRTIEYKDGKYYLSK